MTPRTAAGPIATVREFGDWAPVPLAPHQIADVNRVAAELKVRLGLREAPLIARSGGTGVELKARHVAGFIQLDDLTVEIAPKFLIPAGADTEHEGGDIHWRDAFLAILARLRMLTALPRVSGAWAQAGLPDLMGLIIDDALARAATEGMPRRYTERRADTPSLRGQLDTERLWRRLVEPDFLPCRFDEFTDDTPAARLLKWAATQLSELVTSPALATQLRSHVEALTHVPDELPSELIRGQIRVPPQYGYLDDALDVAGMLAAGEALSLTSAAGAPARAFLWNTATIFEDFVFEVCRSAMFRCGGSAEKAAAMLAEPVTHVHNLARATIPTTPDVVVRRGGWAGVIDAKYKTLGSHPVTADAYQAMAGGRVFDTDAAALIYPAWRGFTRPRTWRLAGAGSPGHLHALPLPLIEMAHRDGFTALVDRMEGWLRQWQLSGGTSVAGVGDVSVTAGR